MRHFKLIAVALILVTVFFTSCKSTATNNDDVREKQLQEEMNKSDQLDESQRGKRPSIAQIFEKFDSNKDGLLSKEEVKGPLAKDFSKIDANNDGFLSKEEIENGIRPNRPRRK